MQALLIVAAALLAAASYALLRAHVRRGNGAATRISPWVGGLERDAAAAEDAPIALHDDERGQRSALAVRLELAEIALPAERVVLLTGVGTVAALVVASLATNVVFGLIAASLVPFAVNSHVRSRIARRRRRFAEQLAEAVQAIAGAMRAGHGLSSSIAMIAEDSPEPMATELRRIVASERLGVPLDDALSESAERTGSRDLQNVGLIAAVQREAGGNGAEALDRVVEAIRRRDDLRRLVTTLTAQGRISHRLLTALPIVLFVALLVIGGDFLNPLWEDGTGRMLTALAVGLIALGSLWIKRIVEFEV